MRSGGSAQQADEQPLEEREDEEEEEEDFRDTEFPEEGELVSWIFLIPVSCIGSPQNWRQV